jgi:hypothetical protein
MEWEMEKD